MMKAVGRAIGRFANGLLRGGSTPARLRVWMICTMVVAVLFGVLGAFGVGRRDASLGDGAEAAAQLLAVQDVQVRLVNADSIARENYLRGGIEDAGKRATYEAELSAVSEGLVAVGNRVLPAEARQLASVAAQLGEYAGLVEQARANNRQGFPVGAAYLRSANALSGSMVAALRDVQSSLRSQVNDSLDRADKAGSWLHVTGWPLVLLLLAGGWWHAKRFRRLVNPALAVATGLSLLLLLLGGSTQGSAMADAEAATATSLEAADLVAQARSAAFEARALESSTLIARGSNNDDPWLLAGSTSTAALVTLCDTTGDCALTDGFAFYADSHAAVRALDDDGDWEAAREASLDGLAADAFTAFDIDSGGSAQAYRDSATDQLRSATDGLSWMRVLVFFGGLAIAALSLVAYGQRLREYR